MSDFLYDDAMEQSGHVDVAIIGGGAAGLTAAIFAGRAVMQCQECIAADTSPLRIAILDSAKKLGAKILVAGGGRCNVTHDRVHVSDFNAPKNVVRQVFRQFDEKAAIEWFASMGVTLKRENTGKLFPISDKAATVLNALLRQCYELHIDVRTQHRVESVAHDPQTGFTIRGPWGSLQAQRLILATGGRSLPRTGSDGSGWKLAQMLGHSVTATSPALVPLVFAEHANWAAALSGIAHEAELSTYSRGKRIDQRTGSLLWTHFGISGPAAMDASRHWVIANRDHPEQAAMHCNFLPGESFETVERMFIDSAVADARRTVLKAIATRLPQRVVQVILQQTEIAETQSLGQLSRVSRRRLVHALTAMPLPIARDRGWNYAEVTAGGIPLDEIDHRTMQSRKQPGLYLIGEVLDCDGRIGGFNFQWAWSTGYIAGNAVGKQLLSESYSNH